MKSFGFVVIGLLAAAGCKSTTPAASTTPETAAGPAASGSPGMALCERFKTELAAQGEVSIIDRAAKPEYAEGGIVCRATVKAPSGLTCHLAAMETAAHATAMAAEVGGGFWPVQQTDGVVVYQKENGTAFLWCGDGQVTEDVQTPARAIVDAS